MCKLCEIKPVHEFSNKRKVCAMCFVKYFEKKFLYTIRKYSMIQKKDKIFLKDEKDFRSVVLKNLLKIFEEKAPVEIVKSKSKATKIAQTKTLDLVSYEFVKDIFENKEKNLDSVNGKLIYPLYLFSDKEVLLYAKLKKLKFSKKIEKKNVLEEFVDSLEKKHLEIKNAIVKSYEKIYC